MHATTLDKDAAYRYDRFTTDVNEVFRRCRKDIPDLKKTKLPEEKVFAEVFVFWYVDSEGRKVYLK